MRSYHEDGHFSARAVGYWRTATKIVEAFPDLAPGHPVLRCHEVAHAVGLMLGLPIVDGTCGSVDHSWLVIPRKPDRLVGFPPLEGAKLVVDGSEFPLLGAEAVLDVYAVGSLPPVQLHAVEWMLPQVSGYHPGPRRVDIDTGRVQELMSKALLRDGSLSGRIVRASRDAAWAAEEAKERACPSDGGRP